MHRFNKDKLVIEERDSRTVKQLKEDCNGLIEEYNMLENPLLDQGQQLATQITAFILKINQLKESNYEKLR
jgi:hypothetical protein